MRTIKLGGGEERPDSKNTCIRAVGISTPSMQCDRRAIRIVLKREEEVISDGTFTSVIISLDMRGTVRVGGDEVEQALMADTWRAGLVEGRPRT